MVATPRSSTSTAPQPLQHDSPHRDRRRPPEYTAGRKRAIWDRVGVHPFRGIMMDLRARAPYYWSDWTDAWDYRVVPATVYIFFANLLPALAFSFDMYVRTDRSYGVNETLLASVLGSAVFSIIGGQPLCIVGVTGPITVFNYTVYDIITPHGIPFFPFMAWICIWSAIMHWILAITNACNGLKYVTRFSCDIFGFYVALIYIQKGVQVITDQYETGPADPAAYLSIAIATFVTVFGYICTLIGRAPLLWRFLRVFINDYGTPLTIVFFTGFPHIGHMRAVELLRLPTSGAFDTTSGRGWFVHFWDISVGQVFLAIPFAILLTILFYFDHNVSSLIAQGSEFPLRKPAAFHWDFFLLGVTTFISGILGLPAPNGLIPQAPFHTAALCVTKQVIDEKPDTITGEERKTTVITHVVEQRVSNLAQGLLTLGCMSGPLLTVLGLIPQAVLAGLFWVMGLSALEGNGLTLKLVYLLRDRSLTPPSDPLNKCRKLAVYAFVALMLLGFAGTFAITQTIAAIGFPVIIMALIPVRTWIFPRWFTSEELAILDAPTASAFTMESVGGTHGQPEPTKPGNLRVEGDRERGRGREVDEEQGKASDDDDRMPGHGSASAEGDGHESYVLQPITSRKGITRRMSTLRDERQRRNSGSRGRRGSTERRP
ncbi:anion exchange family protein [Saitoella complicata NRRL Y-17804]|nr:anion exchange family protein [Saitoella complicata NRRL Y-17804]ODQ50900.1 anion exchange family protein [Saitoella complicata NRRL Y-17804]